MIQNAKGMSILNGKFLKTVTNDSNDTTELILLPFWNHFQMHILVFGA